LIDPALTNGILYGCLYSLLCVGLTLTYMTTKVPNFAHADFAVFAIFAAATTVGLGNLRSSYMTIPVGFLVGGGVAVTMYLLVLKPLTKRGANIVTLMIATLGVDIILTAFLGSFFLDFIGTTYARVLADRGYYLFQLNQLPDPGSIFGLKPIYIVAPITLVITTVALGYLLSRTKFGVAMRAAIENPNLARVVGINVDRVYLISWFIAGSLAGVGGVLYAIGVPSPTNTSTLIIVNIFAGSVLGGLGSIYGGIIGGFLIGFTEIYLSSVLINFADSVWGYAAGSAVGTFQPGIPLAIMIIALLVIPKGLTSVDWKRLLKRFR
jgi:branched-chain amino acid transport system permease protein